MLKRAWVVSKKVVFDVVDRFLDLWVTTYKDKKPQTAVILFIHPLWTLTKLTKDKRKQRYVF